MVQKRIQSFDHTDEVNDGSAITVDMQGRDLPQRQEVLVADRDQVGPTHQRAK